MYYIFRVDLIDHNDGMRTGKHRYFCTFDLADKFAKENKFYNELPPIWEIPVGESADFTKEVGHVRLVDDEIRRTRGNGRWYFPGD